MTLPRSNHFTTMAAAPIAERLALPALTPIATADPEAAVIDLYKIAIANLCAGAFGIEPEKVYPGVDVGTLLTQRQVMDFD